jgi:glycogen debranching enzyme
MKKYILILSIMILLTSWAGAKAIKNYTNSFFGVYGKQASVMGKVDGSAFEIWIYPYKVLHDLRFRVLVEGAEEEVYERLGGYRFSHTAFEREFTGEKWTIFETLFPAYAGPGVFMVLRVHALTDITLEFFFKPDLSPMWPASIGGKYSYFDEGGYFVLSESTSKNFAFFGGYKGEKVGTLPAHRLPGGQLRYRVPLKKGYHEIPLCAAAGHGKYEPIFERFRQMGQEWAAYLQERKEKISGFLENHLIVETPDPLFNEAVQWSMLNVHTAFVDNPDLGEGLIAGYGLSGERERPGFGWYFGGDGLINSYAVVNYGDFGGAGKEIEFLLKYQRQDGKIMHELSQGAKFVRWFEDYGFPFFHGDTTLYFASFLDFYLSRTGDTGLIFRQREKIDKIFSWMLACDADKDGIVETRLAGVGASETGPLRQKMKTDIFLASLSVKAWEAMAHIYTLLGNRKNVTTAGERFQRSGRALEAMFWDNESRYYSYAVKEDGTRIKETTIWPAIGLRFKVLPEEKGKLALRKIASPELSADWGTRFLSSRSGYYDPSSYNNGAVWPFLTGFSSLALYNYGNPNHGFALLRANLALVTDFDYGSPTELLSGDIYRPLDESVPNQTWSSGNTISAFVEGLVGFDANALTKEIGLKPSIPPVWDYLKVGNLKAGKGTINFYFKRQGNRLEYTFDFANLEGYTFSFSPDIPALRKSITMDGQAVGFPVSVKIAGNDHKTGIVVDISGYVYPFVPKDLKYGAFSGTPIIEDFQSKEGEFTLDLWGKGPVEVLFYTDSKIECGVGDIRRNGEVTVFNLKFSNDRWERKTLTFTITK